MRPFFLIVAGVSLLVIGGILFGQAEQSQYAVRAAIDSGNVEAAGQAARDAYGSGGTILFSRLAMIGGLILAIFGGVQAFRKRSG